MEIRVRFAPSPTGELHIGGARTALFNWLFARQNNGAFILRIDDTDLNRSREEYWRGILDTMKWLGMGWDEGPGAGGENGPYFQSERLDIYTKEINRLLDAQKAYQCFCTPEELAAGREKARNDESPAYIYPGTCCNLTDQKKKQLIDAGRKPVVRIFSPLAGNTVVSDIIRGEVSFQNELIEDFVIQKSNGLPTYNFATVVDDEMMRISHVIRAEEHLTNTPRQQILFGMLEYRLPMYAHVPMILAPDRSKLSKRHGATSVQEFRDSGFLPEALLNYLALLGWSLPGENEIISVTEMIRHFSLEKVSKTAAIYDIKKINWLNGNYIRGYNLERLTSLSLPFLQKSGLISADLSSSDLEYIQQVVMVLNDRIKTLEELGEASVYFFRDDYPMDMDEAKKTFGKKDAIRNLQALSIRLATLEPFNREQIAEALHSVATELDVSLGRINKPVRLALSGRNQGPDLAGMISVLGRKKTMARLKAVEVFSSPDD